MTAMTTSTAPKTDKGCLVDDCPGKRSARGYCQKNYVQKKRAGEFTDLRPRRKANPDECSGEPVARGYCHKHYTQKRLAGEFTDLRPKREHNLDAEGLRDHIKANSVAEDTGYRTPCWTWTGAMVGPYGQTSYNDPDAATRRPIRTHRLSYLVFNGPLVSDLVVDHMCRHKACVNPEHLRQVTQSENLSNRDGSPYPTN